MSPKKKSRCEMVIRPNNSQDQHIVMNFVFNQCVKEEEEWLDWSGGMLSKPQTQFILIFFVKMQNSPSKFLQNSFQSSNFVFIHFTLLNFIFIELRPFSELLLKLKKKKNLKNTFQSLIDFFFFNFKNLKKKILKIGKLTITYNK